MLCVIRGEHLEAVQGDFVHPDPLRTFDLDQVAFVYGSRYKGTVSETPITPRTARVSQCTACQMSLIEQTIKAPTSRSIRSDSFRLSKPDSREFPTLARHATPENRMPGRSTPSGNGRAFRLGELRIDPHGRLNRDRTGMSKPRQAINADLRLPLVRQLDGGDARRTPARDRSVAIKSHFASGIFSKTSAAISDRERCLRR
jgi:hypothetical protein